MPLVLFGGSVTTLGAGMAVEGWLVAEGHFLLAFPVDEWFRDLATFVERRSARVKVLTVSSLAAICMQGTLGGFRVLESSPQLAFLHGALAHGVFALLACIAVYFSRAWLTAQRSPVAPVTTATTDPTRLVAFTAVLVYAQIVIGAWYRHTQATLGLALHVLLALAVVGLVTTAALALGAAAEQRRQTGTPGEEQRILRAARGRLIALVWIQVGLGLLTMLMIFQVSGGPEGAVSAGEAVFATLHVGVGAALLAQCGASWMWARRLAPRGQDARGLAPVTAVGGR